MIQNLWATPFFKDKAASDITSRMVTALLQEFDILNAPNDFGTVNVLDSKHPDIVEFKQTVVYPSFNKFLKETVGKDISGWAGHRMHGWLAGSGHDYSLTYHNHRGSQISAVFYLLCEEHNSGGRITFTDPRQNSNRGYDESFFPWFEDVHFIPESGDIAVFPSFLYHHVATYQSNLRIAMPVDLFLHTQRW